MAILARVCAVVSLFLALVAVPAWGQTKSLPAFFAAPPAVKQGARPAGVVTEAVPVKFNTPAMSALKYLEEAEMDLPGVGRMTVVFELGQDHGGGVYTWVGHVKGLGHNGRVVIATGPGGSYGSIDSPSGPYRILPGGDSHDWLVDLEREKLFLDVPAFRHDDARVPEGDPKAAVDLSRAAYTNAIPGVNSAMRSKATPTPQAVIDMMVVMTRGLADKLGATLSTRLAFLVTQANTSYTDSEVAMTMRLVNLTVVDYPDVGDNGDVLDAITPGETTFNSAVFGNIETIRATHGADLVTFLRDGGVFGGSGIAWVSPTQARLMYSVMEGCTGGCESVHIHEWGHNMGNNHDKATFAWQRGGAAAPTGSNFGYAFCKSGALSCNPNAAPGAGGCASNTQPECSTNDPSNFSDIMAYFHATTSSLLKFSNPNVSCVSLNTAGDKVPRPCGIASSADTALSMNNNRATIAAHKISPAAAGLPGQVQFTANSFSAVESSGAVTFTVSRTNGSTGPISVSYALTAGSATAGTDYTNASGILTWAAGDTANKTFTVTVANDTLAEGAETFTATLSNATGTPGVYLGYPTTVTGRILEPWPPGGTFPTGFTQPTSGSSVAWELATDFSVDGDNASLKSGPINFAASNRLCTSSGGTAIPCPSVLQYTGTFLAGTISFEYQVNSYPNNGFFEFLVDGVVVKADSGIPGAKTFSTTITAGVHTLQWRYRPTLSFACANAIPASPQGSSCADRAWIDSVSLPLPAAALTATTTALTSSANPSTTGQSVTFTATVTSTSGTPTGTVTFRDGTANISTCGTGGVVTLASGTATCATSALTAGAHAITAVYSGSSTHATSTSAALNQAVNTGTQSISATPSSLDFGGQSMNTTAPAQTTTIRNISSATLTISAITVPVGYGSSHNCNAPLAANATCTITVTFTPNAAGSLGGAITISYGTGSSTTVPLTGTGERSLVTHYYRSILRRAPDTAGKAYWESEAARVQALGANVNEVWFALAQSFYFSSEYIAQNRDAAGYVTDLYNTFFNRGPDTAGRDYWVGLIGQGLPREVVLLGFMFSSEFTSFTQAIFGSTTVRKEVDTVGDFYRGLLARLPDEAGFNFWVGQFRTAQCQGAAAVTFQAETISNAYANSTEYTARGRSNTQFVSDMYNAFLRRAGDLAGVQFWIGQLNTSALTRNAVRQAFVNSPEFSARVQAVIAEGCRT